MSQGGLVVDSYGQVEPRGRVLGCALDRTWNESHPGLPHVPEEVRLFEDDRTSTREPLDVAELQFVARAYNRVCFFVASLAMISARLIS